MNARRLITANSGHDIIPVQTSTLEGTGMSQAQLVARSADVRFVLKDGHHLTPRYSPKKQTFRPLLDIIVDG